MDTVKRLSQAYGLALNAVELTPDELLSLRHPMIAALDLTQDGEADHYVVVKEADEARVIYYESDGTRESIPTHEFLRLFTQFALLPTADSYGRLLSQSQAQTIYGAGPWDKVRDTVGAAAGAVGGWGSDRVNNVRSAAGAASGAVSHRWGVVTGAMGHRFNAVTGAMSHRFQAVTGGVGQGFSSGFHTVRGLPSGVVSRLTGVGGGAQRIFQPVSGAVSHRFGVVTGAMGHRFNVVTGAMDHRFNAVTSGEST